MGQYSGRPITVTLAAGNPSEKGPDSFGATMVPNPCFEPLKINGGIDWGNSPGPNDTITIPDEKGVPVNLAWKPLRGGWGRTAVDPATGKTIPWYTGDAVPPCTGFWYYRKAAGTFTITITPCQAK